MGDDTTRRFDRPDPDRSRLSGLGRGGTSAPRGDHPSAVPVACTLSSDDLATRRGLWERIDRDAVTRRAVPGGFDVDYHATDDVVRLLPGLADAESECCAFATWATRHGTSAGTDIVTLEVRGPDDAVAALRDAFGVS